LIYDTKRHLRKQTRSILNIVGFWHVEECETLDDVQHALGGHQFDLAVLAVEHRHDGMASMVNDLRRFRCGNDPFLPFILTSWDARLRVVRSIINSGADNFLANPYSTANMAERIDALVNHRKPFVVTEEYFGPDRRNAKPVPTTPARWRCPMPCAPGWRNAPRLAPIRA